MADKDTQDALGFRFKGGDPDALVAATQQFLSRDVDPSKIGDWQTALDETQVADFMSDEAFRHDIVKADGGPVNVWEGIAETEANDPLVRSWIVAWRARTRAEDAVEAMDSYEASWAIRWAHQTYQDRLWLQGQVRAFWGWLHR